MKDSEFKISHLFYDDYALFLGEWDKDNIENLIIILNCFFLISGLRINHQKSNLYGIGVDFRNNEYMVIGTSCSTVSIPFSYLGLPVGLNIQHLDAWKSMVQPFEKRLANWKVNILSSGGKLTLIWPILGSLGIYFFSAFKASKAVIDVLERLRARFFKGAKDNDQNISWVKWDTVLNSKEKGSFGIGSLKAFNIALLLKWRCRFHIDSNSVWAKVIRSIHGFNGGQGLLGNKSNGLSLWIPLVKLFCLMHDSFLS